jgi:hypothetical protein
MNENIKLSTNTKLQLIAIVIALGAVTVANWVLTVLCGSAYGGLIGAFLVGAGVFAYVCSRGQGSALEHFHPPAVLYRLTPIKALAVIKTALSIRYVEDKHWRSEIIEAEEGSAVFICKYVDRANEKMILERILLLKVAVERISDAVSVRFVYETPGLGCMEKIQPAEFCRETTAFLELQLANAEMILDNAA